MKWHSLGVCFSMRKETTDNVNFVPFKMNRVEKCSLSSRNTSCQTYRSIPSHCSSQRGMEHTVPQALSSLDWWCEAAGLSIAFVWSQLYPVSFTLPRLGRPINHSSASLNSSSDMASRFRLLIISGLPLFWILGQLWPTLFPPLTAEFSYVVISRF